LRVCKDSVNCAFRGLFRWISPRFAVLFGSRLRVYAGDARSGGFVRAGSDLGDAASKPGIGRFVAVDLSEPSR
jgi:hypothetical protein